MGLGCASAHGQSDETHDHRHRAYGRRVLEHVQDLVKIHVGVVKRHIIHCIRDESKSRVPDDVFLHERARP